MTDADLALATKIAQRALRGELPRGPVSGHVKLLAEAVIYLGAARVPTPTATEESDGDDG